MPFLFCVQRFAFFIASKPNAESAIIRPASVAGSGTGSVTILTVTNPLFIMHCVPMSEAVPPLVPITTVHVHLNSYEPALVSVYVSVIVCPLLTLPEYSVCPVGPLL